MDLKEISKISFGILSSDEIEKYAVAEINSSKLSFDDSLYGTVYDPRLGSTKNGVYCETCKMDGSMCPGHVGFINFKKPVINPIFVQHVVSMLRCFCCKCFKFLLDSSRLDLRGILQLRRTKRFLAICEQFKKCSVCIHCMHVQPDYKLVVVDNFPTIYEIYGEEKRAIEAEECLRRFENVTNDDVILLGFDPDLVHPKNCIFTKFPILPTCCRPYVVSEGCVCDDDLTYQLIEIIKNNNLVNDGTKYYNNLLFRIQTYFNNTQKKAKHATTGRPIKGIKERIAGKEGQIRNNLLGKRTNQSGRTVIGPDPNTDMLSLIVPCHMADILTIPEYVYERNIHLIYEMLERNQINYIVKQDGRKVNMQMKLNCILKHGDIIQYSNGTQKTVNDTRINVPDNAKIFRNGTAVVVRENVFPVVVEIGDVVHRKLKNGDYVMLNRQPTLHKASMMAFKIRILPVKTLMMNPAVTKPFNCDFDGDEMNIHVAQSLEARAELQELSTAAHCIINSQAGKPNMCIVQDTLTAAYILTKNANMPLSRNEYFRIIERVYDPLRYLVQKPTFKHIIEYILPKKLIVNCKDLCINGGRLVYGTLSKKFLGASNTSLIKIINHQLGTEACVKFITEIQLVCTEFLLIYGFTVHAEDCLTIQDTSNIVKNCFTEAEMHKMNTSHSKIRESKIISCLSKARDIGLHIAKKALKSSNNFITTVESGSKGDYFNIAQITGLLGQQTLTCGRIQNVINNRTRTLPHYPKNNLSVEDEYKSRGFITSSFENGLDPLEFFFHSMSGRKGVSDTAMSTATSGYNMRRIVKLTEDITVHYDGTVRDIRKRQYQMAYNETGYDPTKLLNGQICNVQQILQEILENN
jgi:DNA-directed RNA polymerase beta' subunit